MEICAVDTSFNSPMNIGNQNQEQPKHGLSLFSSRVQEYQDKQDYERDDELKKNKENFEQVEISEENLYHEQKQSNEDIHIKKSQDQKSSFYNIAKQTIKMNKELSQQNPYKNSEELNMIDTNDDINILTIQQKSNEIEKEEHEQSQELSQQQQLSNQKNENMQIQQKETIDQNKDIETPRALIENSSTELNSKQNTKNVKKNNKNSQLLKNDNNKNKKKQIPTNIAKEDNTEAEFVEEIRFTQASASFTPSQIQFAKNQQESAYQTQDEKLSALTEKTSKDINSSQNTRNTKKNNKNSQLLNNNNYNKNKQIPTIITQDNEEAYLEEEIRFTQTNASFTPSQIQFVKNQQEYIDQRQDVSRQIQKKQKNNNLNSMKDETNTNKKLSEISFVSEQIEKVEFIRNC